MTSLVPPYITLNRSVSTFACVFRDPDLSLEALHRSTVYVCVFRRRPAKFTRGCDGSGGTERRCRRWRAAERGGGRPVRQSEPRRRGACTPSASSRGKVQCEAESSGRECVCVRPSSCVSVREYIKCDDNGD